MDIRKVVVLAFCLAACDHNETVDPEVLTNDPQQLGKTSVVIEGNINQPGSIRPIQYGFLWDSVGDLNILTAGHRIELGSTDVKKIYSILLEDLTSNKKYFYRAYASSPDYRKFYYGNEVSFTTLP